MLNTELPVWIARLVGLALLVLGLAFVIGGGIVFGLIFAAVGLSIALTKKRVPRRKCPHCAESIKWEAKVCKHCGRDVPEE